MLVELDEKPVHQDQQSMIAFHKHLKLENRPGDILALKVLRKGEEREIRITLAE